MENKQIELKKTSLYNQHVNLNAKMVNFANYLMPINYEKGIKNEYECVRNDVGLFDVSHMGVFKVTGTDSPEFLDRVLSNNIEKLEKAKEGNKIFAVPNLTINPSFLLTRTNWS